MDVGLGYCDSFIVPCSLFWRLHWCFIMFKHNTRNLKCFSLRNVYVWVPQPTELSVLCTTQQLLSFFCLPVSFGNNLYIVCTLLSLIYIYKISSCLSKKNKEKKNEVLTWLNLLGLLIHCYVECMVILWLTDWTVCNPLFACSSSSV